MTTNTVITNLNKARAELVKEHDFFIEEAKKRKNQIEMIDQVIKDQYLLSEKYEAREIEKETPENQLGYTPTKAIAYEKEVFRYTPDGVFVEKYKNPTEAQEKMRIETNDPELECKSAIGYCCTGSYNAINPRANHHKYKGRVWFDRKLTEHEIQICFELKIFHK